MGIGRKHAGRYLYGAAVRSVEYDEDASVAPDVHFPDRRAHRKRSQAIFGVEAHPALLPPFLPPVADR